MGMLHIENIGGNLNDPRLVGILKKITGLKHLASLPVCLPDIHLKDHAEGPCSFAVALDASIVPDLTAPSIGCGMGIVKTTLQKNDIDEGFVTAFYALMKRELGPRYGHFKNLLLWLGIIERPRFRYDLSIEEFESIILGGARAAVLRYQLPNETLAHVERGGTMFTEDEKLHLELSDILPRISYRSGRHDLGYGFKGNHFLEIEYVEEILDGETAKQWGLTKGQVVIMYHGGGGAVSHHIGRYFGNRKKNTMTQKFVLFFFKPLFHFGSLEGIRRAKKRFHYYFRPRLFEEISLGNAEGKRLMAATKASLNYSYGFRMAIFKRIVDALGDMPDGKRAKASLLWDSIHNAITEDIIHGKSVILHRHTANRVLAGNPVILPGYNTTGSYIGIGLPTAEAHLGASDHGAGATIERFAKEGKSRPHPNGHKTIMLSGDALTKTERPHITDEGVNAVRDALVNAGIFRTVARLRPIAVLKA